MVSASDDGVDVLCEILSSSAGRGHVPNANVARPASGGRADTQSLNCPLKSSCLWSSDSGNSGYGFNTSCVWFSCTLLRASDWTTWTRSSIRLFVSWSSATFSFSFSFALTGEHLKCGVGFGRRVSLDQPGRRERARGSPVSSFPSGRWYSYRRGVYGRDPWYRCASRHMHRGNSTECVA